MLFFKCAMRMPLRAGIDQLCVAWFCSKHWSQGRTYVGTLVQAHFTLPRQVLAAVVRHVDWAVVRCLIIAGPGFAKDGFRAHLEAEAVRRDLRRAPLS